MKVERSPRRLLNPKARNAGFAAGFLRLQRFVRQSSFATANLRSEKPIRLSAQLDPLVANDVAMELACPRAVGCEGRREPAPAPQR
jgi:hypothetical protein